MSVYFGSPFAPSPGYGGGSGPPPGRTAPSPAPSSRRPPGRGYQRQRPWTTAADRRFNRMLDQFRKAFNKYGGGYAALARLDPEGTRRHARMLNAYLSQFLPSWWYNSWEDWYEAMPWSRQGQDVSVNPGGYPGVSPANGWTLGFNCAPITDTGLPIPSGCTTTAANYSKIGMIPAPAGRPSATTTCTACGCGGQQANGNFGENLPAGLTGLKLSKWCAPFVGTGVGASQIGKVYQTWSHPASPAAAAVPWVRGTVVLPQPDPDPWADPWPATQMETRYGRRVGVGLALRPYQSHASQTEAHAGGGTSGPPGGGVHNHVPPRGGKEKKFSANYGVAGTAYGLVTEMIDYVDCAVSAVKGAGKKPRGSPQYKVSWVWKHLDKFDVGSFIECAAENVVVDDLLGSASKNIDRRFREHGLLTGPRGINGGRPSGIAFNGSLRMR